MRDCAVDEPEVLWGMSGNSIVSSGLLTALTTADIIRRRIKSWNEEGVCQTGKLPISFRDNDSSAMIHRLVEDQLGRSRFTSLFSEKRVIMGI